MTASTINKPLTVSFNGEDFRLEEMSHEQLDTLESRMRCYWDGLTIDFMEYVYTAAEWLEILRSEGPARDTLYQYLTSTCSWFCTWCNERVYRLERGKCDSCSDLHRFEMVA